MRLLILIVLISTKSISGLAQVDSSHNSTPNIFFIEVGGSSPIISLNFEKTSTQLYSFRGGFGYIPNAGFFDRTFLIPITISKLFPLKSKANYLEFGISTTLAYEIVDYKNKNRFTILPIPVFGLRTQNLVGGGGFYRFSFNPIYSFSRKNFMPWYGLSFGKSF